MTWWIVGGVLLVLLVIMWFRSTSDEDRNIVSWWAGRNGFRYTEGTSKLLGHFRHAPFDRGTGRDLHDVLSGEIAGRPALITQFSWFRAPTGDAPDGLHSGICSAAVLDLPAPVPELLVRKETSRDIGRDLQLESEEFNKAFRVTGTHDRFTYDVLNPRVMEFLLTKPGFAFRLGGSTMAVWRDGPLKGTVELAEVRDFAATLVEMIPNFVYTAGYPATATTKVSEVPEEDLGRTPVGSLHLLQHLTHRGHEIERYEANTKLWGVTQTSIGVKITVPTVWPVLMIAPKRIASERGRNPRFDDGVVAGQQTFDRLYACGTPRPDFAAKVLTKEFTDLIVARKGNRSAIVVLQSELLSPQDDGVPELTKRGGLWVTAAGELADQELADRLTEFACDLVEALPDAALRYHVDDPV